MSSQHATAMLTGVPRPGRKYFTVAEADHALVYVTRVTQDLMSCYGVVVDIRKRIEHPREGDSREHLEAEYESAMDKLSDLVDELHHVGVELKDFERGLIDFPALHEGREIYLCWRFGETQIVGWHEADTGYSGRQELLTLTTPRKASA